MKKKWYNYFVVSEGQTPDPGVTEPAEPPRRAIDTVPEIEPEEPARAAASAPGRFDEIYQAAGLASPGHGYTVLKVAEMLRSEHLQTLPPDVKRKSILVALEAAGVKIEEIVQDAVRRDRALDAYERVLQKNVEQLRAEKETENQRLEAEINERLKELRTAIERNNKEIAAEQEQLLAWRTGKRQEEDRIAEAVSHFVTENPITTSGSPARGKS